MAVIKVVTVLQEHTGLDSFWFLHRFISTMENTVGHRETERSLQLGHMYDTESALRVGMIDQIVEPSSVLIAAEEELAKWVIIPG